MYNKYQITQIDPKASETEAYYYMACARERGEELLCLCFSYSDDKALRRVFLNALKLLKNYKQAGKITLYIPHDKIQESTTETKYLFNKYPSLENDSFLFSPSSPYILVRL